MVKKCAADTVKADIRRHIRDTVTASWCTTVRRQHCLPTSGPAIGSLFSVTPTTMVRDLGVYYIDLNLFMQGHIRRTVSFCFAVLRKLRTIWRQIPVFQSLIVALVLPRLDYCNTVLYGLPIYVIRRLHVQMFRMLLRG